MINKNNFNKILIQFKKEFVGKHWEEEKYKWEAVKRFQDVWDINEPDFLTMFTNATDKTYNLLGSMSSFPRGMIINFATADQEFTRTMFVELFDETRDLESRITKFIAAAEYMREKYDDGTWKNHYQSTNSISTYLWLRYPDKYYIYKYSEYLSVAKELNFDFVPKANGKPDNLVKGKVMYDEICALLNDDIEIQSIFRSCLTDSCYEDVKLKTLTIDFGFYASRYYWWPSLDEYNPNLTKEDWKKYILEVEKPEHPSPMQMLKAMLELNGEASCKKLAKIYGGTPSYYVGCTMNLGRRVKKYFNLSPCMDGDQERYFPFLFFGKGFDDEDGHEYVYRMRPELKSALEEIDLSDLSPYYNGDKGDEGNNMSKNTILYGPPGTGKTYKTVCYAVAVVENKPVEVVLGKAKSQEGYDEVLLRYNTYKEEGLIDFVTFHQSYGYEEFIEGIKPVVESEDGEQGDIRYSVEDGVFKSFCNRASTPIIKKSEIDIGLNKTPTIWKVSLWKTGDNPTRTECLENGHIRIGWDDYGPDITDDTDFSEIGGRNVLNSFINKMKIGDIVFSCYSSTTIDAIGVVTGEYEWCEEKYDDGLNRMRKVNWIVKGINEDIVDVNGGSTMTLSTVYKLKVSLADALMLIQKYLPKEVVTEEKKNHVFIIDEINRGNISKIFGELITLIEDTKRMGADEEMRIRLPYSQKTFGVPDNVYILGTMNTADRSIAALDTALRRRFDFVEMMPDTDVLSGVTVGDIEIDKMLNMMNKRIEVLFDREHTIGHAYFIKLKNENSMSVLADIFKNRIIPLLQEYFYEDYEKIRLVLADNQTQEEDKQFITVNEVKEADLFGNDTDIVEDANTFSINESALNNAEAYLKIY